MVEFSSVESTHSSKGSRVSPISASVCSPSPTNRKYLGADTNPSIKFTEWVLNPIIRTDISVTELLHSVGGSYYTARRDELIAILDIDVDWRMHAVSDGERRRVQLAMGLLRPWTILLLDEVTVDLDCLARWRFLEWLKQETETRGCTIVGFVLDSTNIYLC